MKNKKAFLDISFSWIFAIIVGAIILGGAIYGLSKFTDTENRISTTESAKEISVLLNPLETSFEEGKSVLIQMRVESKIYQNCYEDSDFGKQGIQVSEYIQRKWTPKSSEVFFKTKYLYLNDFEQGKVFYMFSKPLEIPFKVASLIYLTSQEKNYCFINAPFKVENEIRRLSQQNLKIKDCSDLDISVCFGDSSCDINVEDDFVEKKNEKTYYTGTSLMYAAIFSNKETYECNLNRLMYRISSLSEIYLQKSTLLFQKGCDLDLTNELRELKTFSENFESSEDLQNFENILDLIEYKGRYSDCKLW